ncbi:MAG: ABC transporter ATP-binding protein [Spirochaetales bacterium]|nr:ABC transporter ATP-binding protein [Spirochaetales bacterium]
MDGLPKAIEFDRVTFAYEGVPVLDEACFHVHEGEFACLVGPNGAGKTTILRLLLGLKTPRSGSIRVFGKSPGSERDAIGYVPQSMAFDRAFPVAVREVVAMGRLRGNSGGYGPADRDAALSALDSVGIADLADRPYPALSGGQRRRVLIARALASEPRMLVLDEPTAGVDAASEERLYRTLEGIKDRTTVLIVTHDTTFVSELVDAVLCAGERGPDGRSLGVLRHVAVPAAEGGRFPAIYGPRPRRVVHDGHDHGCEHCEHCADAREGAKA